MQTKSRSLVSHEIHQRAQSLVLNTALIFLTAGSFWIHLSWGYSFLASPLLGLWMFIHLLPFLAQIDKRGRQAFYEMSALVSLQIYYFVCFNHLGVLFWPISQIAFLSTTIGLISLKRQSPSWVIWSWFLGWVTALAWSATVNEDVQMSWPLIVASFVGNGTVIWIFNRFTTIQSNKISEGISAMGSRESFDDQRRHAARLSMIGELTASLGHEISNPLTSIKGYNQQIQLEIKESVKPNLETITIASSRIDHNVDRVMKITKALRKMSRQDRGHSFDSVSVSRVIEESVTLLKPAFGLAKVEVQIHSPADDVFIQGDEVQLSQVLINLLANAKDACHGSKIKNVEIGFRSVGEFVEFYVSDTGSGIPQDIEQQVFRRYFTTKPVGQGTGLGLAISQEIVQRHGGELTYSCPRGSDGQLLGTRFSFTLPRLNHTELRQSA